MAHRPHSSRPLSPRLSSGEITLISRQLPSRKLRDLTNEHHCWFLDRPSSHLPPSWPSTYPWHRFFGFLTVTAIVVRSWIQLQHVALCSDALVRMARRAESSIAHLSSTVVICGPALARGALAWAPGYALSGSIILRDPTAQLSDISLASSPHRLQGLLVSERTQNPSNCSPHSVTISSSGTAGLFLHLPGQLCMSMEWGGEPTESRGGGGVVLFFTMQAACLTHGLKSLLCKASLHMRSFAFLNKFLVILWFFFFPLHSWTHTKYKLS